MLPNAFIVLAGISVSFAANALYLMDRRSGYMECRSVCQEEPMRADARKNYSHLFAVARDVITEHGADASLRDIARRADVGLGTLYRHFSTREALRRASLDELTQKAGELETSSSPDEALVSWFREAVAFTHSYSGVVALMAAALADRFPPFMLHAPRCVRQARDFFSVLRLREWREPTLIDASHTGVVLVQPPTFVMPSDRRVRLNETDGHAVIEREVAALRYGAGDSWTVFMLDFRQ